MLTCSVSDAVATGAVVMTSGANVKFGIGPAASDEYVCVVDCAQSNDHGSAMPAPALWMSCCSCASAISPFSCASEPAAVVRFCAS